MPANQDRLRNLQDQLLRYSAYLGFVALALLPSACQIYEKPEETPTVPPVPTASAETCVNPILGDNNIQELPRLAIFEHEMDGQVIRVSSDRTLETPVMIIMMVEHEEQPGGTIRIIDTRGPMILDGIAAPVDGVRSTVTIGEARITIEYPSNTQHPDARVAVEVRTAQVTEMAGGCELWTQSAWIGDHSAPGFPTPIGR